MTQHAIGCRAEGCQGCVRANETHGFVSPTAVRQASTGEPAKPSCPCPYCGGPVLPLVTPKGPLP